VCVCPQASPVALPADADNLDAEVILDALDLQQRQSSRAKHMGCDLVLCLIHVPSCCDPSLHAIQCQQTNANRPQRDSLHKACPTQLCSVYLPHLALQRLPAPSSSAVPACPV